MILPIVISQFSKIALRTTNNLAGVGFKMNRGKSKRGIVMKGVQSSSCFFGSLLFLFGFLFLSGVVVGVLFVHDGHENGVIEFENRVHR